MGPDVTLRFQGGAALLALNRPQSGNRITTSMWGWIIDCLASVERTGSLRALVISGGGGVFSTGSDDSQLLQDDGSRSASYDRLMRDALAAIRDFPVPTLATIDGPCHGVGCAIVLECDIRFATPWSSFSMPGVRQGLHVEDRTVHRLVSLIGAGRSNDMLFSARSISGVEGADIGLVDRCTSHLNRERDSFLGDLVAGDGGSIAVAREAVRRAAKPPLDSGSPPAKG